LLQEQVKEVLARLAVDTTDAEGSNQTLLDPSNIKDVGNETLLQEEGDDVISIFGATSGNNGSRSRTGNDITSLGSGSGRSASVGEVTTYTIADGVRGGTNALCGVITVIWDEAVLATEVAWLLNVTNRLAVFRVVTCLVSRLA
jgi:hypothetical protein